jgi:anthranilate synthase component I
MNNKIYCHTYKVFADQITPIGVYLNIRGLYAGTILLESSEIDDTHYSHSIICANPIAGIELSTKGLTQYYKTQKQSKSTDQIISIQHEISKFIQSFHIEKEYEGINGFFGFQAFEAVRYFETEKADLCRVADDKISIINYQLFQYVICFNHFNGEIVFIENASSNNTTTVEDFASKVLTSKSGTYPFKITSEEIPNTTEQDFLDKIKKAQSHCRKGDVFQLVLSRKFKCKYQGDEFNVYRALRHINPSPYMFFFDYGSYKIFGSSPETQIRIANHEALINPIAGTYKRTGNKDEDLQLGKLLLQDNKESAEHSMLVDLARNDLNRHCKNVRVTEFKSIKQFSHVIHLVSTVKGDLTDATDSVQVLADTFPAGTLSGAPKVRAIQLLSQIENEPRGYYGGSIGFIDFHGNINKAIIIRSFLTLENEIHYRAGAGIVLNSTPESELKEVDNKLAALRKALNEAQNF